MEPTTNDCDLCAYSKEHGHWGDGDISHCRVCHTTWKGVGPAHCKGCHAHFASDYAFSLHQRFAYGVECRDPATLPVSKTDSRPKLEMTEKGWRSVNYSEFSWAKK